MLRGAARGLIVSPWFAAGAGVVIATSAFLIAPRAVQEFPNNNGINVTHCSHAGCRPTPQGMLPLPLTEPGGQMRVTTATAASGLTFGYYVLWQQHGAFSMEISVSGSHAIGPWQLTFVIPGRYITSVAGANWQRSGVDGVIASGYVTTAGSYSRDGQGGDSSDGSRDQRFIQFIVTGAGTAAPPGGCFYNSAQCHFTRVS
jgi:hypothetical protein